jgi:hypothetical protein
MLLYEERRNLSLFFIFESGFGQIGPTQPHQ